jgi:hypothetical protein
MKNRNIIPFVIAAAVTAMSPIAFANAETTPIDTAKRAISMGYGGECSLEMKLVDKGGYYPCIDIAPYRIVFVYGAVRVFVAQEGREPFPIMEGPQDSPVFTAEGPWTSDLSARVALWWRDTVEGGARKAEEVQRDSESKKAAEEYVNKLMGKGLPRFPTEVAPATNEPQTPAQPEASADSLEVTEDIRRILAH